MFWGVHSRYFNYKIINIRQEFKSFGKYLVVENGYCCAIYIFYYKNNLENISMDAKLLKLNKFVSDTALLMHVPFLRWNLVTARSSRIHQYETCWMLVIHIRYLEKFLLEDASVLRTTWYCDLRSYYANSWYHSKPGGHIPARESDSCIYNG